MSRKSDPAIIPNAPITSVKLGGFLFFRPVAFRSIALTLLDISFGFN